MAASSITKNKAIREKLVKCKVMLCFRRLNVQVIFTVLLDTENQVAAATNFRNHTPCFCIPRRQTKGKATVFKQPLYSLTAQIHPCCPSVAQSEAHLLCQGEHHSSPPAPCLLGISHTNTGGLGAVMLLNTAISKCELKHIKPALRGGVFGGFLRFFFNLWKSI